MILIFTQLFKSLAWVKMITYGNSHVLVILYVFHKSRPYRFLIKLGSETRWRFSSCFCWFVFLPLVLIFFIISLYGVSFFLYEASITNCKYFHVSPSAELFFWLAWIKDMVWLSRQSEEQVTRKQKREWYLYWTILLFYSYL